MPYKIFFSHSGHDGRWAIWLADAAKQSGLEVYVFEHDSQPGKQLSDKIKVAIQQSDALIVLLSRAGQASAYVQQEIGFAEAHRKLIIPLVWPGVSKPALAMLEGREYVQFDPQNPKLEPLIIYLQQLKAQKEAREKVLGVGALIVAAVLLMGGG
jgi:TIR domain